MNAKKGFTLIEMVVALGILAMALTASVTMIVGVVNLAMITRDITEASALAQKALSDSVAAACLNCKEIKWPTPTSAPNKAVTVLHPTTFPAVGTGSDQITDTDYYKITAVVTWTLRTIPYSTSTTQYVRKSK